MPTEERESLRAKCLIYFFVLFSLILFIIKRIDFTDIVSKIAGEGAVGCSIKNKKIKKMVDF